MRNFFTILLSLQLGLPAAAQGPSTEPLTFKAWKDQQILDAQNHHARVNNRLVLLKAGKIKPEEVSAEFNNFKDAQTSAEAAKLTSRAQKLSSSDVLSRLEKELATSQKSLDFARDLGLEEYFLGYLIQFQENPEAIAAVAGRLSKDEVTELLKVLLKNSTSNVDSGESRRLKSALGKLEASVR